MDIQQRLGNWLLDAHPEDAGRVLANLDYQQVGDLLSEISPEITARVLRHLGPTRGAAVADVLSTSYLKDILHLLPRSIVLGFLRRTGTDRREQLFAQLSTKEASALRTALTFGEKTAGALMDVHVLAVPSTLTTQEAIRLVENNPRRSLYYIYVVDDNFCLQGVLNLRELFLAGRKQQISTIMHTSVEYLSPKASYHSILGHPGWKNAHSLPVVDESNQLLGVIRYQALRQIEQSISEVGIDAESETVTALGELFWTGIAGLVGAIGSGTNMASRPRVKGRING